MSKRLVCYQRIAAFSWVVSLAACESDCEGFSEICLEHLNSSAEICECLAKHASQDLTVPAIQWLTASMSGDTNRAMQLKDTLPTTDLLAASMFLVDSSSHCRMQDVMAVAQ